MGWLFTNGASKAQVVREILDSNQGSRLTILDKALVGNNLWIAYETPEGKKFIALYLLSGRGGEGYGYKDMDETMGPYYYDCPLRLLKVAPYNNTFLNVSSFEWREKVVAFHAEKARRRAILKALKPGTVVKIKSNTAGIERATIVSVKPLRGTVGSATLTYRLRPSLIEGIEKE